ncbi:MAG: ferrous iron transport protein A [Gemmatimonadetes bacterium]|nr:ferrous iron transport protein A [Gemmatimonadota bacterium]MBI2536967.1 ferrous iron transport protein A [Gemmatimonadota bacterium]
MPEDLPVTLLGEGVRARVVRLDQPGSPGTAHLVALGVLPGVEVTLLQRYPAFVMRIGHTEFAVDDQLARRIHVGR